MKKQTTIPKSKAKTAYGLLTEVKRLILAEPKRYRQTTWGVRESVDGPVYDMPACGTVACVAGWVMTLKRPRKPLDFLTGENAQKILGLSETQHTELFAAYALVSRTSAAPQTLAYAKAGAAHIAAFQQKYAAQLKAKKV